MSNKIKISRFLGAVITCTFVAFSGCGEMTGDSGGGIKSSGSDIAEPVVSTDTTGGAPTITSFSPTSGAAGTTVTITGTNFSTTPANNTVKFNGIVATVTASTATSLIVTVPTAAITGVISVTTVGGTATSTGSFTVSTGGVSTGGGATLTLSAPYTSISGLIYDPAYEASSGIGCPVDDRTCTYTYTFDRGWRDATGQGVFFQYYSPNYTSGGGTGEDSTRISISILGTIRNWAPSDPTITISRSAGTITFTSATFNSRAGPVTVSGTLNFTPF